jgi:hypothetical protein
MPHRGRLNVLTNVMGKPFEALFHEFKGGSAQPDDIEGSGDVKYHLGASSDRAFDGNKVHLSLSPNPSHLEAVDPVVLGKARAKQDQFKETPRAMADRGTVIPLLRLLPDRALSLNVSACRVLSVINRAARFTSSLIIKSALPPIRAFRAPRLIRLMWRKWLKRRFSMSMAMTLRRWCLPPKLPLNFGRNF